MENKKVLLVIDMQNDFIDGALRNEEAMKIIENVNEKITKYRENGDTIIFTRDTHDTNYLNTNEGNNLPVSHCINRYMCYFKCYDIKSKITRSRN